MTAASVVMVTFVVVCSKTNIKAVVNTRHVTSKYTLTLHVSLLVLLNAILKPKKLSYNTSVNERSLSKEITSAPNTQLYSSYVESN